jgi:glyceraldehyde-3-phosphate dehydrogenase (NADP+)
VATLSVFDALRTFSIRTFVAAKDTETNTAILKKLVDSDDSNFMSTEYLF